MISEKMKQMIGSSSAIRAMFEEGKRLAAERGADKVYDFSLGNPNIAPPAQVTKAAEKELRECKGVFLHGYMSNAGYDDVREKIASSLNARFGMNYGKDGIVMTVGAAGGLNVVLKSLLDPGDEVAVISPYFGEYRCYVSNFGGKLVEAAADKDFMPDPAAIEKALSPKTRALIINTPNNPTGAVYGENALKAIARVLEEAQSKYGAPIYLISDEPYRELVYGGVTQPYVAGYYRNTLSCYSFSKSLSLAGERIGYIAVSPDADGYDELCSACSVATRILGFVNAPSLMQRVAADCIDVPPDVAFYDSNRVAFEKALDDAGLEYVKPQGAFYLFVKAPDGDDLLFCQRAKDKGILIVPSSSFGVKGYARAAYCVSPERISSSAAAFAELAEEYGIKKRAGVDKTHKGE